MNDDGGPGFGRLPGRLATRQPSADDVDGLHGRHVWALLFIRLVYDKMHIRPMPDFTAFSMEGKR